MSLEHEDAVTWLYRTVKVISLFLEINGSDNRIFSESPKP
jgi:hypothetical protein